MGRELDSRNEAATKAVSILATRFFADGALIVLKRRALRFLLLFVPGAKAAAEPSREGSFSQMHKLKPIRCSASPGGEPGERRDHRVRTIW